MISEANIQRILAHMQERQAAWTTHLDEIYNDSDSEPVQFPDDPIDYSDWIDNISRNWNMLNRRRVALEAEGHICNPDTFWPWQRIIDRFLNDFDRNKLQKQAKLEIDALGERLECITTLIELAETAITNAYECRAEYIQAMTTNLHDNEVMSAGQQRQTLWTSIFMHLEDTFQYTYEDGNKIEDKELECFEIWRPREKDLWGKDPDRDNGIASPHFAKDPFNDANYDRVHQARVQGRRDFIHNCRQTVATLGDEALVDRSEAILDRFYDPEADLSEEEEAAAASSGS